MILLTGAPGTGKSTLGRALATALRVPFIARDDVRGGLLFTAGAWGDDLERVPPGDEAVEVFLQTVEGLLNSGVSCVAEYVVRSHRPEDLERLLAAGDCVVIVTGCADPATRLVERTASDRLIASPAVLRAIGAASVEDHTAAMVERMRLVEQEMRGEFPAPVLRVDTTHGYVLDLDEIIRFVTSRRS